MKICSNGISIHFLYSILFYMTATSVFFSSLLIYTIILAL
nr:MAG TPA: hypothetical protein [Caudoviricetes sp.]